MRQSKNKILLFIKIPPPITGATLINKFIADSKVLHDSFNCRTISAKYTDSLEELGIASAKKLILFLIYFIKLYIQLVSFAPKVIYFQITPLGMSFIRDMIYVTLIKLFRKKIIFHLHGKGIKDVVKNNKFKKDLYKFVFNNSYIICLSELLKNDIHDVFNGKVFIVNNAIEKSNNKTLIKSKNDMVTLLFLSNLIIKKGILDFIDSLEILISKGINFYAKIIGDEKDLSKEDLIKILKQKKLVNNVEYLGPKYKIEKETEYINSDIFVFPTQYDVWGLVILEAMQAGLPVISTYEGAIPEIVDDGVTGFLVEKQNPEALSEKIEILIKDRELREKMGKAGRKKFLEKYTLDIFEKNMKNVFDEVLKY